MNVIRASTIFFALLLPLLSFAESDNKKFVVGLILPLSGGLADYGEALRRGFELAAEDEPELFKNLELRYQDSQYDEKVALTAFNALEQQGGVNLYHTWGVSPNAAILPVANARERPVLFESSMRSAAVGRPYTVRAARSGYDAARKLVEAFVKKGWKRVGIVVTQIPYYIDIQDALIEFGKKRGVEVDVLSQVSATDQDFKSLLLKMKGKKYDAIGPLMLVEQIFSFCSQAKSINYSVPNFGAHIHNSVDLQTRCMPFSDGVIFPGVIVRKDFHDRYLSKYHTDLRLDSAADSYETAKMIAELYGDGKSSSLTPQEILDRLKTVKRSESTVGAFQYSETPEAGKAIAFHEMVLTFKDGKIVPME